MARLLKNIASAFVMILFMSLFFVALFAVWYFTSAALMWAGIIESAASIIGMLCAYAVLVGCVLTAYEPKDQA